jgi:hypothetical protein
MKDPAEHVGAPPVSTFKNDIDGKRLETFQPAPH